MLESVEELRNEDRMRLLFARLPHDRDGTEDTRRLVDSVVRFWLAQIARRSREMEHGRGLIFRVDQLREDFALHGMVPMCLPGVISVLEKRGSLIRVSSASPSSEASSSSSPSSSADSWSSWLWTTLVARPVSNLFFGSGATSAGDASFDPDDAREEKSVSGVSFAVADLAKDEADRFVEWCTKRSEGSCLSVVGEQHGLIIVPPSAVAQFEGNADVAITWLEKESRIQRVKLGAKTMGDGIAITAVHKAASRRRQAAVPETVKAVLTVEETVSGLTKQQRRLEADIAKAREEGRSALKKGHKAVAMRFAARAKAMGKVLERRVGALDTLQTVLDTIATAVTDAQVLEACSTGAKALKDLTGKVSADEAERVMDDLNDAVACQMEVDDALARQTAPKDTEEEEELIGELEEMERSMAPKLSATSAVAGAAVAATAIQSAEREPSVADEDKLIASLEKLKLPPQDTPVAEGDEAAAFEMPNHEPVMEGAM